MTKPGLRNDAVAKEKLLGIKMQQNVMLINSSTENNCNCANGAELELSDVL